MKIIKFLIIILFIILTVIILNYNDIYINMYKKTLHNISVKKNIKIIEPVSINLKNIMADKIIIKKNIGSIEIRTNHKWNIYVDSKTELEGIKLYIRPHKKDYLPWILVGSNEAVYKGKIGMYLLSWDLKIITKEYIDKKNIILNFNIK